MNRTESILQEVAEIIRPPRRMSVSDSASQFMTIYRPGGYSGLWSSGQTPYMVAPMDRLTDRSVEAVIFVGPARTGKSQALALGWLTYAICCDPGDMLLIHMTADTARDFSRDDLARLHRHSPEIKKRLSSYFRDDNVFDKSYKHGMLLKLGWPAISQLSGKTIRYVALTDYDRFPENIDGEGDAFTLARKRTQTFMSSGRVLVESSPGHLISDAKWDQKNAHEGPPCSGIFSLYNQGDRQRWYWPCLHCGEYFTAAPSVEAFADISGEAQLICPHCGATMDRKAKPILNQRGKWVADGQTITADGVIHGALSKTTIASYWLTGPAAAFQSWDSLLHKHQAAERELERTGSEETLQSVTTGDFGTAYRPRMMHAVRDPRILAGRAEDWQKREIPLGVQYLTAAVDVQKNRFVVQVVGWGKDGERWLIDRYNLRWSARIGSGDQYEPVDPAKYIEDWQLILKKVALRLYPTTDNPEKGLAPLVVAVDSGGKAGVTERAYYFWKQCRAAGYGGRIMLVKGGSRKDAPRLSKTYPDSSRRADRKANARGEVPVYLLNTGILKDGAASDLERSEPGPGYIHLPAWIGAWFFDELTAETRTDKGWENFGHARNEAFDLFVYNTAAMLLLQADKIDWAHPPVWADPMRSAVSMGNVIAVFDKNKDAAIISRPPSPPQLQERPRYDTWGL